MAPIPFPAILVPSQQAWNPRGGSRSGGQGIEGDEMIVAGPTARWRASATYPCKTRDTVLAMQMVIGYGRAQAWLVGPCVGAFAPRTAAGTVPAFALAAGAALNATALTLSRSTAAVLTTGMTFSIGSRLHRIVALPAGDTGNGNVTVAIRPWLRAAYPAGTAVEFAKPAGLMRFASDDTAEMMMALARFSDVQVDWVEVP